MPKPKEEFIKIASDDKSGAFKEVGDRVQKKELKWSHFAADGSKDYHYYQVLHVKS